MEFDITEDPFDRFCWRTFDRLRESFREVDFDEDDFWEIGVGYMRKPDIAGFLQEIRREFEEDRRVF